jgi:hypothetical protein
LLLSQLEVYFILISAFSLLLINFELMSLEISPITSFEYSLN